MLGPYARGSVLACALALALGCAAPTGARPAQELRAAGLEPWVHSYPYLQLWYPTTWRELPTTAPTQVLRAAAETGLPLLNVNVLPRPAQLLLSYANQTLVPNLESRGGNVEVVASRGLRLGGGTRAFESVATWQLDSGLDVVTIYLSAFTEDHWIVVSVTHPGTGLRSELRQVVRSLTLRPES